MDEQKTQVVLKMTTEPGTEPNSCRPLDQQQDVKLTDEQVQTAKTTNQNELGRYSDQNPQNGHQIQIKLESPISLSNKNDSGQLIEDQQINENDKEQIEQKTSNQIVNQFTTFCEFNSTQKVHVYQINNQLYKMEQLSNSNILNFDVQTTPHEAIQSFTDSGQIDQNQNQAVVQIHDNQNQTSQQNIIDNTQIVQEELSKIDQIVADKIQIGNQNSAGINSLECQEQIQPVVPIEQINKEEPVSDKKISFIKLQPFQNNDKRAQWDSQFAYLITTSVESEKQKINDNMKPPRKPLSPYLFFSQEKRKVIKQERPELNAKQIMKIVSKEWQEITDEKNKEVYEYLSLRDRELYDTLCKHWKNIKEQAHKMGQQVENVYEPMAGTIAHSVSRRSKMNQVQPNNAVQPQIILQNTQQSALQLEIHEQLTQASKLGKRRGRPPKNSMDECSQPVNLNNSDVNNQKQASNTLDVDQYADFQQNKRATKTNEKQLLKNQKLVEGDKISKKNQSDQTDQNEKVRRIFEEKLPTDKKDRLPNFQQLLGPEPSQSQRTQTSKKGRSQRASLDITRQNHVETSLLMQQEEQLALLKNHKSEQKKKRKQSNQMQSIIGQENKTSHSDQEENQQNQITPNVVKNEQQQIKQNNQQPTQQRMELIRPPKLTIKDTKVMKQPNKLKNLFGSEPDNGNENQENSYQIEVNCNMQKRPSTHKNIITYNKIDIADVNNTTQQKEEQLTEPKIDPENDAEKGDEKVAIQINPIQFNQFQQLSQQMINSQNLITNQSQQEYIYPFLNNNGSLNVISPFQFNQNNKIIPPPQQQILPLVNNGQQNFNQQTLQGSQNNFNLINIQIPPPAIPINGVSQLMNSQSPQRRNFSSQGLRYGNNDDMIEEPPESPTRVMFQAQQIPSNLGQQPQQFMQERMDRFPTMIRLDSMQRVSQPNMSRIVNGNTPLTDNSNLPAPPQLMPYNLFINGNNQQSNNQDNNMNNLNE